MTIAIGLISSGIKMNPSGIIFASDSQTTDPGGTKRLDAKKINSVDFADGRILVAQSGSADLVDHAIDILKQRATSVPITDYESVTKVVESAMKEIHQHLRQLYGSCNFSAGEWMHFFRDHNYFELMFGFFDEREKPFIYTIAIDWCRALRSPGLFTAIGCGAQFAMYLMSEYYSADPEFDYGYIEAIAAVEKTINNIDACSRPVWTGLCAVPDLAKKQAHKDLIAAFQKWGKEPDRLLPTKSDTMLFSQEEIVWVLDELKFQEKQFIENHNKIMVDVVKGAFERRKKWWEQKRKEMEDEIANRRGLDVIP